MPVISVDDHAVEPPDLFTSRLPRRFREAAPQVLDGPDGDEYWCLDDKRFRVGIMLMSAVGLVPDERRYDAIRYEEMWPGATSFKARIHDMDCTGVATSLLFPSAIFGFSGRRLADLRDQELGLLCFEAYNDWTFEYCKEFPGRFIAQQIAWLHDVDIAVQQIHKNADRGFRALSWTENPERLGLPTLHSRYWDPLFAACEETGTVLDLHVGSGMLMLKPSAGLPVPGHSVLFPANGMMTAVDWVLAGIPSRFPELKIVFSEAGAGWVPLIYDRLVEHERSGRLDPKVWPLEADESENSTSPYAGDFEALPEPVGEAFKRNFYFASLGEPSAIKLRHDIGIDHIMLEVDYPHMDSIFPDVQRTFRETLTGCSREEIDKMAWRNASEVYRHPMPEIEFEILPDDQVAGGIAQ